jgi:hypothetical protein
VFATPSLANLQAGRGFETGEITNADEPENQAGTSLLATEAENPTAGAQ